MPDSKLDESISLILDKIKEVSNKIRSLEDDSTKFSVAIDDNRVYIAWVGYKRGLQDALDQLRRMNDKRSTN